MKTYNEMINYFENRGFNVFTSLFDSLVVIDNGKEGVYFDSLQQAYNAYTC